LSRKMTTSTDILSLKLAPMVSVVISSYNSGRFIEQCIESLLSQTYANYEIIIVDCSSDSTMSILARFLDSRIRIYHFENRLTPAEARNYAIDQALGEFIALMDSDDYCSPKRLEDQVSHLLETGADISSSYFFEVDVDSGRCRRSKQARRDPDIRALMSIYNPVCNPSVMLKRNILREPPYRVDYAFSEDSEMWCELALRARFTCCPKYLLFYRVHSAQMSQQFSQEAVEWYQHARNDYLGKLLSDDWIPTRSTLRNRLGKGLRMLKRLNERIPGVSWGVNYQIYSRIQLKRNAIFWLLIRAERIFAAAYLTAIGLMAKNRQAPQ